MANIVDTLQNNSGDNIFPIAGGMMADSITSSMVKSSAITTAKIANTAVTDAKIDWSSRNFNGSRFVVGYWGSKPIYRMYFTKANASNNGSYDIPTSLLPLSCTIINFNVFSYTTSGTISCITNYYNYGSDYNRSYIEKSTNNWKLKTIMASARNVGIMVEYY